MGEKAEVAVVEKYGILGLMVEKDEWMAPEGFKSLLFFYPAGDVDSVPWPMKDDEDKYHLSVALYDAREMGDMPDVPVVKLPDGSSFDIEDELGKGEEKFRKNLDSYEF